MNTKKQKIIWILLALVPLVLYSIQGLFVHAKLWWINSEKINPSLIASNCDEKTCTENYSLVIDKKYLLLGHILQTHKVLNPETNDEILPISTPNANQEDLWVSLMVYDSSNLKKLYVEAKRPKSAKLNGFVGLLPRTSDNREIFSIPDISRTISIGSQISAILILVIFFSMSLLNYNSKLNNRFSHPRYLYLIITLCCLNLLFASHFFDVLFSNASIRTLFVRTFGTFGVFSLSLLIVSKNKFKFYFISLCMLIYSFAVAYFGRIEFGSYPLYAFGFSIPVLLSIIITSKYKDPLLTIPLLPILFDSGRIFGWALPDYPPIYWHQMCVLTFAMRVAWKQGASNVLPMLSRTIESTKRDLNLNVLYELFDSAKGKNTDINTFKETIKQALEIIPKIVSCKMSSMMVFLPNEKAITFYYDKAKKQYSYYNDSDVKGYIFTRVLLYEEQWFFKTIDQIRGDGHEKLQEDKQYKNMKYLCALPLKSHNQIVGAISLTGFKDALIDGPHGEMNKTEIKQKIMLVANVLENMLGSRRISSIQAEQERLETLKTRIERTTINVDSTDRYLQSVCKHIKDLSKRSVVIFNQVENKGYVHSYAGLDEYVELWKEQPLNLNPDSHNRMGSVVVAFLEGKSSYVKDVREIYTQLHPKSQELFDRSNIDEFMCLPITLGKDRYVIALMSEREKNMPDPQWLHTLEGLRSSINMGYKVVYQRSSLSTYGSLAARLIEDDEIRQEVLGHAETGVIPSLVGKVRSSLLCLVDLQGSSKLKLDPMDFATRIGSFHDKIAPCAKQYLSGIFGKHVGDAVLIATNISSKDVGDISIRERIVEFGKSCNQIGLDSGCKGTRLVIHHGEYFYGLASTSTSSQVEPYSYEVNNVFKLEGLAKNFEGTKFLISRAALNFLEQEFNLKLNYSNNPSGHHPLLGEYFAFSSFEEFLKDDAKPLIAKTYSEAS